MSMKIKAAILVSSFAVLLFVVVGSLGGVHASSNDGSYRQMQVYSEVLSRVQSEYVEDPEHSQGDGRRSARPGGVARRKLQLPDAGSLQGLQGAQVGGQGRNRRDGLEALWICRCGFGAAGVAGR